MSMWTKEQAEAGTAKAAEGSRLNDRYLLRCYEHRAWQALEFESWMTYCDERIGHRYDVADTALRDKVIKELADEGWTQRATGRALGINHQVVQQVLGRVAKSLAADGPDDPRLALAAHRRKLIESYVHSHPDARERDVPVALASHGITKSIVQRWVQATGHVFRKPTHEEHVANAKHAAEVRAQRAAARRTPRPMDPDKPVYLDSHVLATWRAALKESHDGRYLSQLAHDVTEAIAADDHDWLETARGVAIDVASYMARFLEVLDSPAARDQATRMTVEKGDDYPPLRAVASGGA